MNLTLSRIIRTLLAIFAGLFTFVGAARYLHALISEAFSLPFADDPAGVLWPHLLVALPWYLAVGGGYVAHLVSVYKLVRPGPRSMDVPVLTLSGLLAPLPVSAWAIACTVAVDLHMHVQHPYTHALAMFIVQATHTLSMSMLTFIVLTAWFLFREPAPQGVSVAPR